MSNQKSEDKKVRFKTLIVQGTKYRTTLNKKYSERVPWSKPEKNNILSFIPGTILKIYVKKDQCVKKGEILLVLEAMKMQNQLTSPIEGVVKSINVKEGDRVPKGKVMIEIGYS